jgi:hypothetical protein
VESLDRWTLKAIAHALIAASLGYGCCALAISSTASSGNAAHDSAENSTCAVQAKAQSSVRHVQFSGFDWVVKSRADRVGPGPNYFSDSAENVEVDGRGRLHLRISRREGRWSCAEIISRKSFGYGTYRFYLDTPVDSIDPQVVLGMFTWSDDPADNHREIDIEISRWGTANNENGQFVVQPYTRPPNIVRFQIPVGLSATTHIFTWKPDTVVFQDFGGQYNDSQGPGPPIREHTFTQDVPRAGDENARINLWLLAGKAPSNDQQVEVIISKFEFSAQGRR